MHEYLIDVLFLAPLLLTLLGLSVAVMLDNREFFYYQHDERIDWDNLMEIVEKKRNHPKFL